MAPPLASDGSMSNDRPKVARFTPVKTACGKQRASMCPPGSCCSSFVSPNGTDLHRGDGVSLGGTSSLAAGGASRLGICRSGHNSPDSADFQRFVPAAGEMSAGSSSGGEEACVTDRWGLGLGGLGGPREAEDGRC